MAEWHDYGQETEGETRGPVAGTLKVYPGLESPELGNTRDILVHLPASYGTSAASARRYPVIYMHDGQNLFDSATSFSGDWQVDETLTVLGHAGLEIIAVGVPHMGIRRINELSPFSDPQYGEGCGDTYLRFIVDTVKPLIDRSFRTLPGRAHTTIAGSSMGGLISLYAFFRYPDIFGAAGIMSPALWFARRAIFPFLDRAPSMPGRLYLDIGTNEGANTVADVRRLRNLLSLKGYRPKEQLLYVEEEGAGHSEADWARRLPRALQFLFAPAGASDGAEVPAPSPYRTRLVFRPKGPSGGRLSHRRALKREREVG